LKQLNKMVGLVTLALPWNTSRRIVAKHWQGFSPHLSSPMGIAQAVSIMHDPSSRPNSAREYLRHKTTAAEACELCSYTDGRDSFWPSVNLECRGMDLITLRKEERNKENKAVCRQSLAPVREKEDLLFVGTRAGGHSENIVLLPGPRGTRTAMDMLPSKISPGRSCMYRKGYLVGAESFRERPVNAQGSRMTVSGPLRSANAAMTERVAVTLLPCSRPKCQETCR
jgi:hypothetical protein